MIKILRGFLYALTGIYSLIKTELNFRIHCIALIILLAASCYFKITTEEWLMILSISALVLSLEAMNTAIEKLCDLYSMNENAKIKTIKDIAAGAVLISVLFAIAIGILVFWKYLFNS